MKTVISVLLMSLMFLSCAEAPPPGGVLSSSKAAKRIEPVIPAGWRVGGTVGTELPVTACDFSGDGKLDFIALLESDGPGGKPNQALYYVETGSDGRLRPMFLNRIAFQEGRADEFRNGAIHRLTAEPTRVVLEFRGGGDWQWSTSYSFSPEAGDFYLDTAQTLRWHTSAPKAVDQKDYDFKSYFLKSTVITECGDMLCTELQLPGNTEKLRVKLSDFHYSDSLHAFASIL